MLYSDEDNGDGAQTFMKTAVAANVDDAAVFRSMRARGLLSADIATELVLRYSIVCAWHPSSQYAAASTVGVTTSAPCVTVKKVSRAEHVRLRAALKTLQASLLVEGLARSRR
jgi:hypothetical protein